MNRRSLLGFLGGAVASGPKLAQDIVGQAVVNYPTPAPSMGGLVGAADDGGWKLAQIARLQNYLANGPSKEDRMRHRFNALCQLENQERFRLDSLRSPSPSHKARMLVEGNAARQDRIRRLDVEMDLDRLLNPANW